MRMRTVIFSILIPVMTAAGAFAQVPDSEPRADQALLRTDSLVAWCIVPFDAMERSPAERAAMLRRLGLLRLAYDWRERHVPFFEEEILAMREAGIEFFAFWSTHDSLWPLIERHGIRPQIWHMLEEPSGETQEEKVAASGRALLPLVEQTRRYGLKLGLYNHGGWQGEPENLAQIVEWLRAHADAEHVGIVYNFHHGHADITDFENRFRRMLPYLLCVNLNGMSSTGDPKILTLGEGEHEEDMLRIVRASGYVGPLGIIDHQEETDAEETLRENLEGLERIMR